MCALPAAWRCFVQAAENVPRQNAAARAHLDYVKVLRLVKLLPNLRYMTGKIRAKDGVELGGSVVVVPRSDTGCARRLIARVRWITAFAGMTGRKAILLIGIMWRGAIVAYTRRVECDLHEFGKGNSALCLNCRMDKLRCHCRIHMLPLVPGIENPLVCNTSLIGTLHTSRNQLVTNSAHSLSTLFCTIEGEAAADNPIGKAGRFGA